ncbi:hypothetical protein L917_02518 [Phytophthora nicotianae]|uniref:GPI inositol-deacylase n=1 Tax=Phytophthora nicotianae TaxID=4792 RepID=W2LVZ1_PHYNI|nr:hypothetical protein L917_02518 [Phytophthora nicotianae]
MRVVTFVAIAVVGFARSSVAELNASLQTSLYDAPSLKLHVALKRKTMELHGQSEFDIYATPIVSTSGGRVFYNSFATFCENEPNFNYTIVDGSAYIVTSDAFDAEKVECLPLCLLPFDEILPALNNAKPIPSASIGDKTVECPSGNLLKTTFAGTQYAICASGETGVLVNSSDLDVTVEYLDDSVDILKPHLTDGPTSCEPVEKPISLTPTAFALVTGKIPSSTSRMLKEEVHMEMETTTCETCLSTPRPCIFLHGLGNPNEEAELQDTSELTSGRLGDIHGHAPCCSEIKYAILNTVDAGWRNDTLHKKFCDFSLSMSSTSNVDAGIVDNTIIVTHSMGGLVVAHALAKGACKFSETTSWVAISAPMTGSMAADFIVDYCNREETIDVAVELLELIGQCPASKSRRSTTYQGGKHNTPPIDAAFVAAQEAYRGTVIPHKSKKNDGFVEFQSCLGGLDESQFGNHYLDRFYRPQLNHADTAFKNGDGLFKDSKKPNKWFECLEL